MERVGSSGEGRSELSGTIPKVAKKTTFQSRPYMVGFDSWHDVIQNRRGFFLLACDVCRRCPLMHGIDDET